MILANAQQNSQIEETENILKKRYFLELIRLTSLQPEQVDPILPVMIHQTLGQLGIRGNLEELLSSVKKRILSEDFIDPFFPAFNAAFSLEEVVQLLNFYKSDVLRKFIKQGMKLYHPLFEAYRKVVKETIEENS